MLAKLDADMQKKIAAEQAADQAANQAGATATIFNGTVGPEDSIATGILSNVTGTFAAMVAAAAAAAVGPNASAGAAAGVLTGADPTTRILSGQSTMLAGSSMSVAPADGVTRAGNARQGRGQCIPNMTVYMCLYTLICTP